jgi:leucyl-tRNA synthetase
MMDRAYDPQEVEARWQEYWERERTNVPDLDTARRPFYNLMMFPYPSAEGLHVGNVFAFTGSDIQGRFHRMRGFEVFEPMGFDAFGIHSENFAMKIGTHPARLIPSNIANFRRQLTRMGFMFDWTREVQTTDPAYYKWTQWIFLKLFENGLAYRAKAPVNWCPACKTVLADEQVIGGMCERHPDTAVERRDTEQWFFRTTAYAQRLLDDLAWIDWSETTRRAQINWLGRSEGAEIDFAIEGADGKIRVFTTRPDTLYGATYMVLAPEHPLVELLASREARSEVEAYRLAARARKDVERLDATREKTGVFIGAHAINPATGRPIPIWTSDYVLMGYGTGAIMAVPAHDQRDHDFATRFGLPILPVIFPREGELPAGEAYEGEGVMGNSGPFDGSPSEEAKTKVTEYLASKGVAEAKVNFRLRDWCVSRQRYWGPPIPVVYCDGCGIVGVPEKDLPVLLPETEDFVPDASGVSPLARVKDFYHVDCPRCGKPARRETDVSDNFLDSAWYFLRYPSTDRDDVAWDAGRTKRWLPVSLYIGGNEHAVLHLMYTRFLCMAFKDIGLTEFDEPFVRFRAHGLLIKDGSKMSKSRGNVVNPDAYIAQVGADSFRMYLMFLGPYEEGGDFRDQGIVGIRRFLERAWRWIVEERSGLPMGDLPQAAKVKLHQAIEKVTKDTAGLQYNTAIATMMELLNVLREAPVADRFSAEAFVRLLAPYAPHLAEELWVALGHAPSVTDAGWPDFDPTLTKADTVEIAVQVNGKLRDTLPMPRGSVQETVQAAAVAREKISAHVQGKTLRKVFFVPDRLINLVVG